MINCIKCDTKCIPMYELNYKGSNKYVCRKCAIHIIKDKEIKNDKRINKIKKSD